MTLQIKRIVACFCIVAGLSIQAEESAVSGKNMLRNPGFEASSKRFSHWGGRNWWSKKVKGKDGKVRKVTNKYSFSIDTKNPHSGKNCMKISMTEHLGGDLQFVQNIPVKPGMALKISCWLYGPANTAPLRLLIRQDERPWKSFFEARLATTGKWQYYEIKVTLPPKTTTKKTALMFQLREANTVLIDDVSVEVLPDKEPGKPLAGNRIANGSFEVGRDKWYATFRENNPRFSPESQENNCKSQIRSVPVKNAPAGKNAMFFEVFPHCSIDLTSAFFPLKYGHETTIRFKYKTSNKRRKLKVRLICGEFPNIVTEQKYFTSSGNQWQQAEFKVKPKPSETGRYTLSIATGATSKYWIDDVRVFQDGSRGRRIVPEIGWEQPDKNNPGNFYKIGDKPQFEVMVSAPGKTEVKLSGNIVDAWERELRKLEVTVKLDKQGYGKALLPLPECKRYGTFKATLTVDGSSAMTEILFAVPHELVPPEKVADSFFGGHVKLNPYNLMIAKKAGFRWLRMHPPNDTKWYVCERTKGKLEWFTKGSERAHAMGFKLLGNLGTVPVFYANKPPKAIHNWYHAYPPKGEEGWKAYERYVAGIVEAFKPYIDTWEIGNESDGKFLQVPQGMNREEIYMEYVRRTFAAVNGSKDIKLIAGVITGAQRPFMGRILDMGVGKYVDAVSFHHYSPKTPAAIRVRKNNIREWESFKNREGQPMPVWHTEGFGRVSPTWMQSTGTAFVNKPAFHLQWESAGITTQSAVIFKALGVKKHFIYAVYASSSGRIVYRNECSFMTDINGLPLPALAAHAASVFFLEGAKPLGMKFKDCNGVTCGVASFEKDGKTIDVLWSKEEIKLGKVKRQIGLNKKYKVYDMMGNELKYIDSLQVSAAPLYFVEN